jgi:hypothetical protein
MTFKIPKPKTPRMSVKGPRGKPNNPLRLPTLMGKKIEVSSALPKMPKAPTKVKSRS